MAPQLVPLGPGFSVSGRLDRSDLEALARAGVRTIINNRPDGEDPGQLPAAEARRIAELHGLIYHHIPITAATDREKMKSIGRRRELSNMEWEYQIHEVQDPHYWLLTTDY